MSPSGPGETLFGFVRHWSRRTALGDPVVAEQGRLVLVTEVVHTLTERGLPATVNAVGHEIGIDQSGASRLVRSATDAGYLVTQTSETDARRREVTVTDSGAELLDQAHSWQEEVFARLTDGWSEARRREFARSMAELVERSHTLDA